MNPATAKSSAPAPAIRRLAALSPIGPLAMRALEQAMAAPRIFAPRRDLIVEGHAIGETLLILEGWAARTRELSDGRRQIVSFVLPGDFVGLCEQREPVASSTVVAINPVRACPVPDRGAFPDLDNVYALSRAMDEAHLIAQVMRLGRLNAHERIVDLMLELAERLTLSGLSDGARFALPITQEMLADALGLTPVHVNRTLQLARKTGEMEWRGREVVLHNIEQLTRQIARVPVKVRRGD